MTITVHRRRGEERWTFDYAGLPYSPHELVKPRIPSGSSAVMQMIHVPDGTDFVLVPMHRIDADGPHYCRLPDGSTHTANQLVELAARTNPDVYAVGIIV